MNVKKIMKSINVILINLFYKKYVVNIMNVKYYNNIYKNNNSMIISIILIIKYNI